MQFEWDKNKAKSNFKKHGVDFAEATSVLKDAVAITLHDEHPTEDRYITIGINDIGQLLLLVVYTLINNKIRIISARKANIANINNILSKAHERQLPLFPGKTWHSHPALFPSNQS
jgi:uncharacterized DUF497 family protein